MRKIYSLLIVLLLMGGVPVGAQQKGNVIKSRVVGTDQLPLEGAIVSIVGTSVSEISDENGEFEVVAESRKGTLRVVANGYYTREYPLRKNAVPKEIVLVPESFTDYAGTTQLPFYSERRDTRNAIDATLDHKDMKNTLSTDLAWQDGIAGLQVTQKSGMPGEGSYFNLRGIHSLVAENTPLLVINGIPYLFSSDVSSVINGYSRDALFGYNANDIKSITTLKGAEAAMYGSLGSNGVILIETQQATSDNLNTRVSFTGTYGVSMPKKSIPTLNASQYTNYLQDVGMTRYGSSGDLVNDYPFLSSETNMYSYLFDNDIDWNDEVTRTAFVTDNVFRIEGGDEIAKYNFSFGYTGQGGIVDNTSSDRYHTMINSSVMVSRWVDIFTNVNLAYITSDLQEQGMKYETNPLLAASAMMPNLYPYTREANGDFLSSYATYNSWNVNSNPTYAYDNVSNPTALVNTVEANDKIYDVNVRGGLNWRPTENWTITGMLNIYYNYTEESLFVPGVSNQAIVPQLYGTGNNYVSKGVRENHSYFYGANVMYQKLFNKIHDFKAYGGVRLLTKSYEYDFESGYNTANDNYKTLTEDLDEMYISGSNDEWKWLSYYLHADYTFNHLVKAMAGLSIDGTTVSGLDAARFGFFPSAGLTFFAANTGVLPSWIDLMNFSAEVSLTGNSR
ncbi:MAG: TonB-dependent receptor plug domain-containing protein, partial [Porphyromonadaceae bacterium]|nr:TonB-dependent receptor plug domain-containing protein [Porphyromonadaceae bacterium]